MQKLYSRGLLSLMMMSEGEEERQSGGFPKSTQFRLIGKDYRRWANREFGGGGYNGSFEICCSDGLLREYFKSSNGDIFETIEKAIIIVASDYSKEFRIRRDGIAQTLFSCKLIKCSGCDNVELGFPEDDEHEDLNVGNHQINNYDYGVTEALTDEGEDDGGEEESECSDEERRKLDKLTFL
ncbi:hypothetical protein L2E82_43720 [Cichorium intybus]|uniref:Uncharacterized protein n=1 Tax=Cichorium intybus TaxID=13427 RepID=A0ACB8ZP45_CICIN|nr:hypothetical protein L2E82_43720 [Cichorium intybus]